MNNVQQIIDLAEQRCESHGARLTDKRKQILHGLLQSDKALSAYELIDFYKTEYGEAIPAMSVYRILEFLREEQLVHKLNLANKYVACAHITCDHDHAVPQFLICGKCQKVEEISISKSIVKELQKNVVHTGFHLVSPQLEMNCVCENCMKDMAEEVIS